MARKSKWLLSILLVFTLMSPSLLVSANPVSGKDSTDTAEETIINYYAAINNKDWNTFISLNSRKSESLLKGYLSQVYDASDQGLLSVKSAKVKEMKKLPSQAVADIINLDELNRRYENCVYYLVGVDYSVRKESKYYLNGVNYDLLVLGQENGTYKILLNKIAPLTDLVRQGYGFNNSDENAALKVINNRSKDIYTNLRGNALETNTLSSKSSVIYNTIPSGYPIEPSRIRIYHAMSSSDEYYHRITTVNFDVDYVEDVLGNEWDESWNMYALEAGALTVKEYGWYKILYPDEARQYGADVLDSTANQKYILNSHTSFPRCTSAVNTERNVAVANTSGQIFRAEYLAGSPGYIGPAHSGTLYQNGTQVLANSGYYPVEILNYYYGDSDKSSNGIVSFQCY